MTQFDKDQYLKGLALFTLAFQKQREVDDLERELEGIFGPYSHVNDEIYNPSSLIAVTAYNSALVKEGYPLPPMAE